MKANTIPPLPSRVLLVVVTALLVWMSVGIVLTFVAGGSALNFFVWALGAGLAAGTAGVDLLRRRYWRARPGLAEAIRAFRPAVLRLTENVVYRNPDAGVAFLHTRTRSVAGRRDWLGRIFEDAAAEMHQVVEGGAIGMLPSDHFIVIGKSSPVLHSVDLSVLKDIGADGLLDVTPEAPQRSGMSRFRMALAVARAGSGYASEQEIRDVLAQLDGAVPIERDKLGEAS